MANVEDEIWKMVQSLSETDNIQIQRIVFSWYNMSSIGRPDYRLKSINIESDYNGSIKK